MSQKIDFKKTKEKFDKLLAQAKESVKVLETLKEEGLAKARSYIPPMPSKNEAQRLANEKFVEGLKKLGLATRSEVRDLERKVDDLTAELKAKTAKKSAKKTEAHEESASTETEA